MILRAIFIAALSLLFLTGADHAESPALIVHASDGTAHEFDVLSWSWIGAESRHAALPGKAKSARFQVRARPGESLLERWRRNRTMLPEARFESEKSGRLLYFVLSGVTVESVEPVAKSNVAAVWITVGFFEANAASSAQNANDSIWLDLGHPVMTREQKRKKDE